MAAVVPVVIADCGRVVVFNNILGVNKIVLLSPISRTGLITTKRFLPVKSLHVLKFFVGARDEGKPSMSSLNDVPVFVVMGSTFTIAVKSLWKTTTEIWLRFTMVNVSLADVSHIGIVAQESDNIAECEYKQGTLVTV